MHKCIVIEGINNTEQEKNVCDRVNCLSVPRSSCTKFDVACNQDWVRKTKTFRSELFFLIPSFITPQAKHSNKRRTKAEE